MKILLSICLLCGLVLSFPGLSFCANTGDFDEDGDVDGLDLVTLADGETEISLDKFVVTFGSIFNANIEIVEIWSDQIPNVKSNYLPGGAGTDCCDGSPNFIMMGARNDGMAYMKVRLSVTPDTPETLSKVLVRPAIVRRGKIYPVSLDQGTTVVRDGDVYSISTIIPDCTTDPVFDCFNPIFPLSATPVEYYIAAGIDADESGELEIGETFKISDGLLRVVSQKLYNDVHNFLSDVSGIMPWFDYPYATDFVQAFLQNIAPNISGVTDNSPVSIADIDIFPPSELMKLEHNVGVIFTDTYAGPINDYIVANSALSEEIIKSATFRRSIEHTIEINASEVDQTGEYQWELEQEPEDMESGQKPNELLFSCEGDEDLFSSFGKVVEDVVITVTVECIDNLLQVERIDVSGSIYDLYDFDYGDSGSAARLALYIQTGYGTLGSGGKVFRNEVLIDGSLHDISQEFGTCGLWGLGFTVSNCSSESFACWPVSPGIGCECPPSSSIWGYCPNGQFGISGLEVSVVNGHISCPTYVIAGPIGSYYLPEGIFQLSGTQSGDLVSFTVTVTGSITDEFLDPIYDPPGTVELVFTVTNAQRIGDRYEGLFTFYLETHTDPTSCVYLTYREEGSGTAVINTSDGSADQLKVLQE